MRLSVSSEFTPYTGGVSSITCNAATLGEALETLLNRFPQLHVHLMCNDAEAGKRSILLLNGDPLWKSDAMSQKAQAEDELLLVTLIPHGKDGESVLGFFIDPLSARLIENKQAFGIQGYGWTMPGAATIMGQHRADEWAGIAMQVVGYIVMVVGCIISAAGAPYVGFFVSLAGSMLVTMGSWSIASAYPDISLLTDPCTLNKSAAYTFNGVQNTTPSGTPFQIVYGEHRVGGHVLNLYVLPDAPIYTTDQTSITYTELYAQIGLCEGEIESITAVEIDKLPYTFYNAVETYPLSEDWFRSGRETQSIMPAFSVVQNSTTVERRVT